MNKTWNPWIIHVSVLEGEEENNQDCGICSKQHEVPVFQGELGELHGELSMVSTAHCDDAFSFSVFLGRPHNDLRTWNESIVEQKLPSIHKKTFF